jgi:hypothetical protein
MRGQIWCIFGFSSSQKVWLMRVYGLREVWIKRGLTVYIYINILHLARVNFCMSLLNNALLTTTQTLFPHCTELNLD